MTDVPNENGDRLRAIERRLERIEQFLERSLERETVLREQLAQCEESRRQLAEQTRFLIDRLGDAQRQQPS